MKESQNTVRVIYTVETQSGVWKTSRAPRIAVVDDDPSFLKLLTRIARRGGVRVFPMSTWEELKAVDPARIDGLIIDYDLGITNGLYVTMGLRHLLRDIPVVLVSQQEINLSVMEKPKNLSAFVHKREGHEAIFETMMKTLETTGIIEKSK